MRPRAPRIDLAFHAMAGQAISICSTPKPEPDPAQRRGLRRRSNFSFIDRQQEIVRQPLEFLEARQSGTDVSDVLPHFRSIVMRNGHSLDAYGHQRS